MSLSATAAWQAGLHIRVPTRFHCAFNLPICTTVQNLSATHKVKICPKVWKLASLSFCTSTHVSTSQAYNNKLIYSLPQVKSFICFNIKHKPNKHTSLHKFQSRLVSQVLRKIKQSFSTYSINIKVQVTSQTTSNLFDSHQGLFTVIYMILVHHTIYL